MKFAPVFFCLFFLPAAHARLIDRTAALVNSDVVLASDVLSFKKNSSLRREIDPFVGLTGFSSDANKDVLDYLVQEHLVMQKHPASPEETEEEINAVQRNNKIERDRLREVLKAQGVDFEDYRNLMAVSVSKRKLIDRELRPLAAISDEEVKNFYYTDPAHQEARKAQRLVLTYKLQQLLVPSAALSDTAARRLRAGEDFDTVASELAAQGAESSKLPVLSEENMNASIREAVRGLKVGGVTKALPAGSGYMLLKILELGAPKDPTFEAEKERLRGQLFQKALINQLKLWTERERAAAYIHFPKG